MTKARIFRPAKNAMQSGLATSQNWHLTFEPETARNKDPLTGHISSSDTRQQINMSFPTKEAAVSYAQRHGVDFQILEPKARKRIVKAYSDNFSFDRQEGNWTH
ncbi:ETC complex I subunit [Cohaesibacter haloalkalitolerans]|uniref:ETC complex I subunit n=1 Tax=Cohaesibacter haloalkalitolerans TaxID=1162980 RepID=UPI000E64C408|nr:ETC complex I subunit [Cohaesibacter haloalkalitolerans]